MKLLIGYGNTMRQDDGVGCSIAEQLALHYAETEAVRVLAVQQLMPEIAAEMAIMERVVFVDATVDGKPGTVTVTPVTAATDIGSAHDLRPPQLLRITMLLFGKCPPTHLVTITGGAFDFGETLSKAVTFAIPQALAEIQALLAS